jgi:vacuolar iron transporter family protein
MWLMFRLRGLAKDLSKYSFGATSAITTSLALIVGLDSALNPRASIVGALLVLAVADNISDSLGIHIYRESQTEDAGKNSDVHSISNFLTRLVVTLAFAILVVALPIGYAVISSIVLGISILTLLSYLIAIHQKTNPVGAIFHHVGVTVAVLIISHFLGQAISRLFGM